MCIRRKRMIQLSQGSFLLSMSYFTPPYIMFSIRNWESMVLLTYEWFERKVTPKGQSLVALDFMPFMI